jgi:hypothetical protein
MIHQLEIEYIGKAVIDTLVPYLGGRILSLYFTPIYYVFFHLALSIFLSLALFFLFEKQAQRIFNRILFSLKRHFR